MTRTAAILPASSNASSPPLCASRALDQLALSAQRGERGACDALVDALLVRLRPLVSYRVLTRARGALVPADIDDVLQDVVLIIWQHDLPLFDPSKSGFLTFVTRRLTWHLADRARRARRNAGVELDDAELEAVEDPSCHPEAILEASRGERALADLPRHIATVQVDADARLALVRHDLEGATLAEVARELNVHVSNACRARQRGLKRLARHLEALAA